MPPMKKKPEKPAVTMRFYEQSVVDSIAQAAPIDGGAFKVETIYRQLSRYMRFAVSSARRDNEDFLDHGRLWEIVTVPDETEPPEPVPFHNAYFTEANARIVRRALRKDQIEGLTLSIAMLCAEFFMEAPHFVDERATPDRIRMTMKFICEPIARAINSYLGV